MKKVIIGIVAAAVLATGAIFVFAQKAAHNGPGGFGPGHGGMAGMMLRHLDLTEDQQAKVKAIFEASKATVEPIANQLRENHKKLAELGTDGKFDQAGVEALAAEQSALMSKMIVEKEKAKAQVFAILTDEQKTKAAEMRQKGEERMKGHGPFGGKRGGDMAF